MNIFNRWKWEPGRQYVPGSGPKYEKMLLFRGSFWDTYLLRYPVGAGIPFHTDPVVMDGLTKKHFRLNIILSGQTDVTEYKFTGLEKPLKLSWWRFVLFRPDLIPHRVKPVTSSRSVLSIGWIA